MDTKVPHRFFCNFEKIEDCHHVLEISRAAWKRKGIAWRNAMYDLGRIVESLEALRRDECGEKIYHMEAVALHSVINLVMHTAEVFRTDPTVQTVQHIIHALPYWRRHLPNSHRNSRRQIEGYAITHTIRVKKGGDINRMIFPASVHLAHEPNETSKLLPLDLIVNRYKFIDCTRLAVDAHSGGGFIEKHVDQTGRKLVLTTVQVDPKTKEKKIIEAARLTIG
jgi:hypothetical protein